MRTTGTSSPRTFETRSAVRRLDEMAAVPRCAVILSMAAYTGHFAPRYWRQYRPQYSYQVTTSGFPARRQRRASGGRWA